jgi:hypothetical protein
MRDIPAASSFLPLATIGADPSLAEYAQIVSEDISSHLAEMKSVRIIARQPMRNGGRLPGFVARTIEAVNNALWADSAATINEEARKQFLYGICECQTFSLRLSGDLAVAVEYFDRALQLDRQSKKYFLCSRAYMPHVWMGRCVRNSPSGARIKWRLGY